MAAKKPVAQDERPGHEYDPVTGRFIDGPHPDDPDNDSADSKDEEPEEPPAPDESKKP